MIAKHPIELAYCLSLIDSLARHRNTHSITPPWVLKNYPHVERIMFRLRNTPCVEGCPYCNSALDIHKGLKRWFGFDSFRSYAGEPLQEHAVRAAVDNKSLLAVFPTGGGKSITFQLPALMSGENAKGLTIVISPLQSLMKDQVDNLEKPRLLMLLPSTVCSIRSKGRSRSNGWKTDRLPSFTFLPNRCVRERSNG